MYSISLVELIGTSTDCISYLLQCYSRLICRQSRLKLRFNPVVYPHGVINCNVTRFNRRSVKMMAKLRASWHSYLWTMTACFGMKGIT